MFSDKVEIRTDGNGNQWLWPKDDQGCWYAMSHDHANIPTYLKYIPEDKRRIIIQAGGNAGWMPAHFSRYFQIVYTFEPDPLNFYCLTNNCQSNNIVKFQAPLGESHDTKVVMQLVPGNHGMHFVTETAQGALPVIRIDDLNVQICDFIQLDTEAYELPILKGARETILRHKPVIALELATTTSRYNYTLPELYEYMDGLGYKEVEKVNMDYIFIPK